MQDGPELHSIGSESAAPSGGATFGIREVSALLAVPAPTIRSWERRHALAAARDERGHRRYSDADVAVLRRVRDERANGKKPDDAVAVATAAPPGQLRRQLLTATQRLDDGAIRGILDFSVTAHGLPATLEEVLLPSMREIGVRWSRGECDVAQEHLATTAVLAWLARRAGEAPEPRYDRPVVLSCGPQDQHTIALEAFTVLLLHRGVDCRNLGAQTPAASLRVAVDQCAAAAVVLVSHLGRNRASSEAALRVVGGSTAALFYAGGAFRSVAARRGLPGHYLGGDLCQAADQITSCLST